MVLYQLCDRGGRPLWASAGKNGAFVDGHDAELAALYKRARPPAAPPALRACAARIGPWSVMGRVRRVWRVWRVCGPRVAREPRIGRVWRVSAARGAPYVSAGDA